MVEDDLLKVNFKFDSQLSSSPFKEESRYALQSVHKIKTN